MILFFDFLKKSIQNLIHQLRLIRVGIMPRIFQPVDRDPRPLVPRLVVTDAGTGMVFFPADQQSRALKPIRQVRFHRAGIHVLKSWHSVSDRRRRSSSYHASNSGRIPSLLRLVCRNAAATSMGSDGTQAPSSSKATAPPLLQSCAAGARNQATQTLSAFPGTTPHRPAQRIRFARANSIFIFAVCFRRPRYRVFR